MGGMFGGDKELDEEGCKDLYHTACAPEESKSDMDPSADSAGELSEGFYEIRIEKTRRGDRLDCDGL